LVGGVAASVLGLLLGERALLTPDAFTPGAVYAFFHLLVFGSLLGFVAYNYLLANVSSTMASTYSYVNPVVALLVGWAFADEPITRNTLAGMVIILSGVAMLRFGGVRRVGERRSVAGHAGVNFARPGVDPAREGQDVRQS
jgi:drug/metabolite transporter (DMT)-like permease